MGATLPDVDKLSDDEEAPPTRVPAPKAKGTGKGKNSAGAKSKPKAKPKPEGRGSPSKAAASSSLSLKRPAASATTSAASHVGVKKKPAAAVKPVLKKPAAATMVSVCKYLYKSNGVWGFKIGGREKLRAPWRHHTSCQFRALVLTFHGTEVQGVNLQSACFTLS